ncbi:DNA polymerase beta domain protein region [Desulfotomaculum nigrificans CO-1-SRB]|uniref:DNA polymerase beta domain protein region n=1 Tax=Desulfotomaculum nigrificans (strain DSM 14880 / VKM B-2319 / CO-1-SRB) TaxID=868595 RepID=F6B5I9_DESCC|nr:DNA polymerase beta domain protein region [Desulfotomaculum nigrificans CO-1-SRB]
MLNIETIKAKVVPILKNYGVNRAYLFGSFARGEQTEDSDIDLLVEYAPGVSKSIFKVVELKYELEEALQRKVDIVTEQAISPYIRPYTIKDRQVIM